MKKYLSLFLVFALCLSAAGVPVFASEDIPTADTDITLTGKTLDIKGDGVELDENDIVIEDGGTYRISGTFEGFRFVVKAEGETVTILLDNAVIVNETDEALYAKKAESLTVYALPGTVSTLTTGLAAELEANKQTDNSGAALKAKCPLTVTGTGSLTVNGYINNGIAAEGDITLSEVNLAVTCANDAIKSDATVTVTSGTYTVTSGHDAFYAATVLTIEDGTFTVFTGVGSADADMKVSDSLMMGNMGGGDDHNRDHSSSDEASGETDNTASGETSGEVTETASGEPTEETSSEEITTETASAEITMETASQEPAETDNTASDEASGDDASDRHSRSSGEMPGGGGMMSGGGMPGMPGASGEASGETETVSDSAKGLKAASAVKISGGTFLLDCEDDAVHSDGTVTISGGDLTIYAGDDGIHGTDLLYVTGGSIFILRCYEGMESSLILIDDGIVNIVATDDGFNASNGTMGGFGGFGGSGEASEPDDLSAAPVSELEGPLVRIRGGVITIDSGGDGLDSNGSMYIYGGTVRVSGPSSDWDAAIDTGEGGSTFLIAGGDVMAAGYSSMAETPESAEASQCSIYCRLDEATEDGTLCTLTDSEGNVIQEFAFVHGYNCVIFSSPKLVVGETYTITAGNNVKTIELTDTVYSERLSMGGMGGGMMPGGGGHGGR